VTFVDDLAAVKAQADTVRAQRDGLVTQMSDALFTRLRPLPAISWMTDAALRNACSMFAQTAVSDQVRAATPAPVGQELL
jgi:hypothetical protein